MTPNNETEFTRAVLQTHTESLDSTETEINRNPLAANISLLQICLFCYKFLCFHCQLDFFLLIWPVRINARMWLHYVSTVAQNTQKDLKAIFYFFFFVFVTFACQLNPAE